MPGITEMSAVITLSEIGVDMNIFDDVKHLCSWCVLSPINNESADMSLPTLKHKVMIFLYWLNATITNIYLSILLENRGFKNS
jgi:hypothetical protein